MVLAFFFCSILKKRKWLTPKDELGNEQINILNQEVAFYRRLNTIDKKQFENEIAEFLLNYKITPIDTQISEKERLLIAASGVIPIFVFPDWQYVNLKEILVYKDTFNTDFDTSGDKDERNILGMVGTGMYSYKMFLSKRALINGFASDKDGHNTAIHEFVHLIDGMDGNIDGLPEILLEQPYILPWLDMIRTEIKNIHENDSELRPYGGTEPSEFFAVASEFFFERPELLQDKHPELFGLLIKIFDPKNKGQLTF